MILCGTKSRNRLLNGSSEPPASARNGECDFHGEKWLNETYRSTTAEDAQPYRESYGQASRLCFIGHGLIENRNGLAFNAILTRAALAMAETLPAGQMTLGSDMTYEKGTTTASFGDRRPHHSPRGQCPRPENAPGYRGDLRLAEDRQRSAPDLRFRGRSLGAYGVHLRPCRLEPHSPAEATA